MSNNIAPFAIDTAPPFELQMLASQAARRREGAWVDRVVYRHDDASHDRAVALHTYWGEVHARAVRELVWRIEDATNSGVI